jgi:hypothetical protein
MTPEILAQGYTIADIAVAHEQAQARRAELRRQLMNMTGSTPLILRKAVIVLEAEILNNKSIQRRYHIVSIAGYWAVGSWITPQQHVNRVDKVIAAYSKLPTCAAPPRCPKCNAVLTRPNRMAKYCSPVCQRAASNAARYERKRKSA